MGDKFIAQAIRRPGQLHRDLHVPQGRKIPASKLQQAMKAGGKVAMRARLAKTLARLRKMNTT